MADLSGDRAQLILVAGLALAATFVAIALILNSAIYTENLASRGEMSGGSEALGYRDAMDASVGELIEYANEHNATSHGRLHQNLSAGLAEAGNLSTRLEALDGRLATVSLAGDVNGTRIVEDEPTTDFTNETGVADWTVVEDVSNTRAFHVEVTDAAPLVGAGSNPFTVTVTDGTDTWQLTVTDPGTGVDVNVEDAAGNLDTCHVSSAPDIDVTGGTVNGEDCDALVFAEGLTPPYDISYQNANNVQGNYSLVVDNSTLGADPDPTHLGTYGSGTTPFAAPATYSATVHLTVEGPELVYESDLRVAPGETDG